MLSLLLNFEQALLREQPELNKENCSGITGISITSNSSARRTQFARSIERMQRTKLNNNIITTSWIWCKHLKCRALELFWIWEWLRTMRRRIGRVLATPKPNSSPLALSHINGGIQRSTEHRRWYAWCAKRHRSSGQVRSVCVCKLIQIQTTYV